MYLGVDDMDLLQMENIVATQIKVRVPRVVVKYDSQNVPITIADLFPKISFTTEISDSTPSFPNVYIHELESSEVGNSIPNQEIHAIRDTIQIDVSTNVNKSEAHIVANAVVRAMKVLRYSTVTVPIYSKLNNVHRYTIRFRRIVASGDTF